jgi:hypothetical protein
VHCISSGSITALLSSQTSRMSWAPTMVSAQSVVVWWMPTDSLTQLALGNAMYASGA